MTIVVYIIGAALVLVGAVFIAMGVPVVRLEIGWSEVIGGSVAGSAGFVVLALGAILARLESLQRTILNQNLAAAMGSAFSKPEAWDEPVTPRPFAPHPLAPTSVTRPVAPVFEPEPVLLHDPEVEPEPPLAEATLHPEPAALPSEELHGREPALQAGAPALATI